MIQSAIIVALLTSPGITALVERRVKPQGAPEVQGSAYPHITVTTVSDIEMAHSNLGRGSLRRARIQVDAWAKTSVQADDVATQVVARLAQKRAPDEPQTNLFLHGPTGIVIHNGRVVQGPLPYDEDLLVQGSPTQRVQRARTDFEVQYSKP